MKATINAQIARRGALPFVYTPEKDGTTMVTITACWLASTLSDAKKAHTDWEQRFRMEGNEPPEHTWENWYARFIYRRMQELEGVARMTTERQPEIPECSGPNGSCTLARDGAAAAGDTLAQYSSNDNDVRYVSEPGSPDAL